MVPLEPASIQGFNVDAVIEWCVSRLLQRNGSARGCCKGMVPLEAAAKRWFRSRMLRRDGSALACFDRRVAQCRHCCWMVLFEAALIEGFRNVKGVEKGCGIMCVLSSVLKSIQIASREKQYQDSVARKQELFLRFRIQWIRSGFSLLQ